MNDKRYKLILYVIVFVILGTISIQVYWNYKNYLTNKQQLINDVQASLDNSIEAYYTNLASKRTFQFAFENDQDLDSILKNIDISSKVFKGLDSLHLDSLKVISFNHYAEIPADSTVKTWQKGHKINDSKGTKVIRALKNFKSDTLLRDNFKMLTSKVIISMSNDSLGLKDIDSLFRKELDQKHIVLNYGLSFNNFFGEPEYMYEEFIKKSSLKTSASSSLLPEQNTLTAHFSNETSFILKRIMSGILISTILILAVISCLFYLLKIIKHQKQLAEVKNDLISNITHEFKTPIATISVALESIKDFDVIDDKNKTKTYLDMSSTQLSKLNLMVEKLLETATLDSESLDLKKEDINLVALLYSLTEKYAMTLDTKTLNFQPTENSINACLDIFHFENAISNIIDNAIKYGGNIINIEVKKTSGKLHINIADNGTSLTKAQVHRIFEKFYRVPKGNTHDVKGFGIGLYYTRKIIEKHDGSIEVDLNNNKTTFKISLPNG